MKFTKMQSFGNDYVYIDAINQEIINTSALARFVSDRHFGIGSDGMVLICPSDRADFRMRIFNPDGSEAEMCGNALRSVGKYVYDYGMTKKSELTVETLGGIKKMTLFLTNHKVSNIRANIGKPTISSKEIPVCTNLEHYIHQPLNVLDMSVYVTAISWGNPHLVIFIEDIDNFDVHKYGKALEHMTFLFPNKTNVTFAQCSDRQNIKIREWERGTGETIGCGTGCCSAVAAGVLTGICNRTVNVKQTGGTLMVDWDETTNEMYMTGPSHTVFESDINAEYEYFLWSFKDCAE